jgi:adenylate cyclase
LGKSWLACAEDAYRQVKARLDLAVTDLGSTQLKNIAEPVRAYSLEVGAPARAKPAPEPKKPAPGLALPDKPSIAVLPFQNMSGDPEQEYFADGMVEDIITGLSRIKWLFVIARNSSFTSEGRAVDVRQVGRELGVRCVLEGGVRKSGSRLRITGQLVEADTGAHLWADKFDGAVDDVFALQDQISGVVEPSLQRSEIGRSRRNPPENLDAYDLYLRALPHMAPTMPEQARIAAGFLEKALELDPNYAAAHTYLAFSHEICFIRGGFSLTKSHCRAGSKLADGPASRGRSENFALDTNHWC